MVEIISALALIVLQTLLVLNCSNLQALCKMIVSLFIMGNVLIIQTTLEVSHEYPKK